MRKAPRIKFGPPGHCIYCGKTSDLRTEHIIPYGLGGNLEFLEASCGECGTITGCFEGVCLKESFYNLRVKYDVQTRRPKKRKRAFPVWIKRSDGVLIQKDIGRDDLPLKSWALPLFENPSLSSQISPDSKNLVHCQLEKIDAQNMLAHGSGREPVMMTISGINLQSFARMLAKIAHSYACALLPPGSFRPCLNKLILEGHEQYKLFVGGEPEIPPAEDFLWEMTLGQTTAFNGIKCLVVRIRLFSYLGTPVYIVAVGEPIGDPLSNLEAGRYALPIKITINDEYQQV